MGDLTGPDRELTGRVSEDSPYRTPPPTYFGQEAFHPGFVAPIIPGKSDIGQGIGFATAEHQHPFWIHEHAGIPNDASLIADGFDEETLESAEGAILVFDKTANRLYVRESTGAWHLI